MCIMAILLQVRYNERFYVYMDNHVKNIVVYHRHTSTNDCLADDVYASLSRCSVKVCAPAISFHGFERPEATFNPQQCAWSSGEKLKMAERMIDRTSLKSVGPAVLKSCEQKP